MDRQHRVGIIERGAARKSFTYGTAKEGIILF